MATPSPRGMERIAGLTTVLLSRSLYYLDVGERRRSRRPDPALSLERCPSLINDDLSGAHGGRHAESRRSLDRGGVEFRIDGLMSGTSSIRVIGLSVRRRYGSGMPGRIGACRHFSAYPWRGDRGAR
ncbi:MAG: hypothetical protein K8F29_00695 [Kofleriaceae bacterium]|nr:hypothetical protein [Candidatus Methylomirabilis lanthanidiphila]